MFPSSLSSPPAAEFADGILQSLASAAAGFVVEMGCVVAVNLSFAAFDYFGNGVCLVECSST